MARAFITTKDFRRYPNAGPKGFTRVEDGDLDAMLGALKICFAAIVRGHPIPATIAGTILPILEEAKEWKPDGPRKEAK